MESKSLGEEALLTIPKETKGIYSSWNLTTLNSTKSIFQTIMETMKRSIVNEAPKVKVSLIKIVGRFI